jgi:hypothetical protein
MRMPSADLDLRADAARPLAGGPIGALLWLKMVDHHLDKVGRKLGGWSGTRFCASVASAANIMLAVSLLTPQHLEEIVTRLTNSYPTIDIADRGVVLSMSKINGSGYDDGTSAHTGPTYQQRTSQVGHPLDPNTQWPEFT